ncbi:hypothetical protein LCGC14_3141060, partial [marine sediment metagenome]
MDEKSNVAESLTQDQLEAHYYKSLQGLEEGQMITGHVVQVSPEQVFIDVGYKS